MKTFNDSKSQHLEELEALISSSLSEKELEDRLSDYHDNDIAEDFGKADASGETAFVSHPWCRPYC